jgi:Homeodomain-like domain-containing protein
MTESPTPDREDILKLRQQGLNRDQIAEFYGVSLSRVKRWIREMDIPMPGQAGGGKPKQKSTDGTKLGDEYGMTLVERAKRILGRRMSEDRRGYLLDGRLCRVDILIIAAGLKLPEVH